MKTLKTITVLTVLSVAGVFATGCTAAQKGAAGGGLVGGVVGSVIGNNWVGSAGPATGAAVGGASGAAVGGIAGDAYARVTEEDKERELQNLRAQLEARENELASLRATGLTGEGLAELESLRSEIDAARAELANARANADELALTSSAALQNLDERERQLSDLEGRLAEREGELADVLARAERDRLALENDLAMLNEEADRLRGAIDQAESELAQAREENGTLRASLSGKEVAVAELTRELDNLNVRLEETSRGLTMTIVDSLLFAPGEADLTTDGRRLMGDVARILNDRFPDREFLIEGHTDNQPIVRSGWRSNWELGAARALNMLHELVSQHGIKPQNVSATSFGEFRPATTNATPEGRRENRRAVIVILPEKLPVEVNTLAAAN